jgi:hypothetical protein
MAIRTLCDRQVTLALVVLLATMGATVARAAVAARESQPQLLNDVQRQSLRRPLRQTLVVPDVTKSAFVFAKTALTDDGFGWRVVGRIGGYSSSLVVAQSPAPGTRVLDTGAPRVLVRLRSNPNYPPVGQPQNTPPFRDTKLKLAR